MLHPKTQRAAEAWFAQVQAELRRQGVVCQGMKPDNKIRLLVWRVWCLRYGVKLPWLVATILAHYDQARSSHSNGGSLGMAVATLTGPKTQDWVETYVAREFPNGEQFQVARSALQGRMLATPSSFQVKKASQEEYARSYREQSEQVRQESLVGGERFPRPWRGNPWR